MPSPEEYLKEEKKKEEASGSACWKTTIRVLGLLGTVLAFVVSIVLVGIILFVVGIVLAGAIVAINVYVGVNSGSSFVEGSEGQQKIGNVSVQWVAGRFVFFAYFCYPLLSLAISSSVGFCCPPKAKDAPTLTHIIELERREHVIRQQHDRTIAAIKNEAKTRKMAMLKEIAFEEIRIKHSKAAATEKDKKKEINYMKERLRKKYEMEAKAALQAKYERLRKLEAEKAALIRSGKLTKEKEKEIEVKQKKEEKVTPIVLMTTESTGLFTEETKREMPSKNKQTTKPSNKIEPARRNSIDTKATAKTAATKKKINDKPDKPALPKPTLPKPSPADPEKKPVLILSTLVPDSPVKNETQNSKPSFADMAKKAEPRSPKKYTPGVRTKMKVPTFNNTAGKGPLRIPANYKFANERLANR